MDRPLRNRRSPVPDLLIHNLDGPAGDFGVRFDESRKEAGRRRVRVEPQGGKGKVLRDAPPGTLKGFRIPAIKPDHRRGAARLDEFDLFPPASDGVAEDVDL